MKFYLLFLLFTILYSCTDHIPSNNDSQNLDSFPHFIKPSNFDTVTTGDTIKWSVANGSENYILSVTDSNSINYEFQVTKEFYLIKKDLSIPKGNTYWNISSMSGFPNYFFYNDKKILTLIYK